MNKGKTGQLFSLYHYKGIETADRMSYNPITNQTNEMGSAVIYRQEIIQDIALLTSEPKARFYSELFSHLDLSNFSDNAAKTERKGFSNQAKPRAAIVMKCECFSSITDLLDYL